MAGLRIESRVNIVENGCHRLRMWTSDYDGIDPNIFVYQRVPSVPEGSDPDDQFVNVASVADLEEYPHTLPGPDYPFFRLPSIDLVFRSVDLLTKTVDNIRRDIEDLLENLDALEDIGSHDIWDFNYTEYESSSSSSYSSESSESSSSSSSSS